MSSNESSEEAIHQHITNALKEHAALLYDVPISLIIFLSIAYGAVALAAIIGNSVVLWGFVQRSSRTPFDQIRLRKVTNMFIINLAIADILIGAFAIPFQFISALLQRWILPNFMCPFCSFIQIVSVNVSIFTLVAIATDRYLIVEKPLLQLTKKKAKHIIIVIWITAVAVALPAAIALRVEMIIDDEKLKDIFTDIQRYINFNSTDASDALKNLEIDLPRKGICCNKTFESNSWIFYNRCLVFIQYLLPVSIIIFLYGKLGLKLTNIPKDKRHSTVNIQVSHERDSSRNVSIRDDQSNQEAHSPSDFELSNTQSQSTKQASSTLRTSDTNVIYNNEARAASISTNAEYIATHKRRVLKMLLIVVALFALCWLPLQTYHLLQYFVPSITSYSYINVIWFVCHFLAMLNSCLNPFVYAIHTLN